MRACLFVHTREADPIIGYDQSALPVCACERDRHVTAPVSRKGVLESVGDELSRDQSQRHRLIKPYRGILCIDTKLYAVLFAAELLDPVAEPSQVLIDRNPRQFLGRITTVMLQPFAWSTRDRDPRRSPRRDRTPRARSRS